MSAIARVAQLPSAVRHAVAHATGAGRGRRLRKRGTRRVPVLRRRKRATRRVRVLRRPSRAALVALAGLLTPGPRQRRVIASLALAGALLGAGYLLWLRDSGLVRVDDVTVTGVTSDDAAKIRAALVRAGQDMTTLHVDRGALERAVSRFPEVRKIEADPDFPSGLAITVIERPPVAVLVSGDHRLAVATDGTILTGLADPGPLPEVKLEGPEPRGRLSGGGSFMVVQVLGTAPPALAPRLERATRESDRGVVVQLSDGPELVFGDTSQLEAKWAAAARVLADEDADGAEYIDVTIPERPAAGGLAVETVAPVLPAGEGLTIEPVAPETAPEAVPLEPQP